MTEPILNCAQCGEKLPETIPGEPFRCPHCGWESDLITGNPVTRYVRAVVRIMAHPTAFFRGMPVEGGVGGPMAFALINHWLGSAVSYLWKSLLGASMSGYFNRAFKIFQDVSDVDNPGRAAQFMATQEKVMHWMWGTGSILLDPFLTLFHIAFVSLLVFVGARICVPNGPATPESAPLGLEGPRPAVTYESAVRIVCFGLTPAILAGLPFFGGLIGTLFVLVVTVIGARTVYRVSTGRAIVIALFPKILFFALLLTGFALLILFAIQMFTSFVS